MATTPKISTTKTSQKAKLIQSGDKTQSHDQLITWQSLSTMKAIVSSPPKPMPLDELELEDELELDMPTTIECAVDGIGQKSEEPTGGQFGGLFSPHPARLRNESSAGARGAQVWGNLGTNPLRVIRL